MKNLHNVRISQSISVEMENLRSEVQVLKRTVESKTAAVNILRQQLCDAIASAHTEAEETSSVVKQDKATQADCLPEETSSVDHRSIGAGQSNSVLAELLSATKRENKSLKQDIMDLKCKLHDAQADLKVVRSELRCNSTNSAVLKGGAPAPQLQEHWRRQERLRLIQQMEELREKVSCLERDTRSLTQERDELLRDREEGSAKVAQLSKQLEEITHRDKHRSNPSQQHQHKMEELKLKNVALTEQLCEAVDELNKLRTSLASHLTVGCPNTRQEVKAGTEESIESLSVNGTHEGVIDARASPSSAGTNTPNECDESERESIHLNDTSTRSVNGGHSSEADCKDETCDSASPEIQSTYPSTEPSLKNIDSSLISSTTLSTLQHLPWLKEIETVNDRFADSYGEEEGGGAMISDCVEEIVPLDQLDTYMENVKREQVLQAKSKQSTLEEDSAQVPLDQRENTISEHDNSNVVSSFPSSMPPSELCNNKQPTEDFSSDLFSDYDSDDENFQAELDRWQKSAVGQLSQAQKK